MGNFLHETCPGVGRGPLWRGPHLFGLGAALRATSGLSLLRGGPVHQPWCQGVPEKEHGEEGLPSPPGGVKNWGGVPASEL